jgi:mono/diheme cytochrome c family protein
MRPICLSTASVAAVWATAVAATDAPAPTFSKDIAPIIYKNCTICHRPGEAAPFALETYADVKKRGELIAHAVESRLMPPWKADRGDAPFRNERRLTDDDVDLIARWVAARMPQGSPADLPPPRKFTPGWALGEPDLVVTMKEPFRVPAEGPDIYRNFAVPLGLTEDRWVRAIDFRPQARAVVHHSLFFVDGTGRARALDEEDPAPGFRGGMGAIARLRTNDAGPVGLASGRTDGGAVKGVRGPAGTGARTGASLVGDGGPLGRSGIGSLGGWALGAGARELPDGLAFHVPAGSDLILSTHFHPSGKEEHETSTVGFYFADSPPTKRFTGIQLPPAFGAFEGIDISAGAKDYVIEDSFQLPIDVKAFGAGGHAHYIGKTMTLTATLPGGQRKTLLSIPDWDFAWQEQYEFAQSVSLPKGTVLHSRITFDNSADNPRNPRLPPVRVAFGEESTDEMGSMSLLVVAANESELPTLQAAYRDHFREALAKAPLGKMLQDRLIDRLKKK